MTVRLIPVLPVDRIVHCDRELGQRHHGYVYVLWDRHKRLLLTSQSISRLASVVQALVRCGGEFDLEDNIYPQALYNLVNGHVKGQFTKNWRAERVLLRDLPTRFTELQQQGFAKSGIVCSSEVCWKIVRADTHRDAYTPRP